MRLVLITQNERMFLPKVIDYLLRRLDPAHEIVGAVLFDASPFGKKMPVIKKIKATLDVFGVGFVFRYGINVIISYLRGSSVSEVFKKNKINVIVPTGSINSIDTCKLLAKLDADLFVSITGNQIFKKKLIEMPRFGTINLHSALLPKYRGLMPSFWTLKNQEKQTGVSVFFMDEGIDSGPIIVQKTIRLGNISQWKLIEFTKFLGMEAIIDATELIEKNNVTLSQNNNDASSYYSFPTKKDVIEFKQNGCNFF